MTAQTLIDSFGRRIRYLRLSVTDRCNLRCQYCMAENMTFLPKSSVLTIEEMVKVCEAFIGLSVEKIRLTGGEPLVRNGVIELAECLSQKPGLKELAMTTNGVLLDKFAAPLKLAGVNRLNISLDSLKPERFKKLSRVGNLDDVLRGIAVAKNVGFDNIKINAVILKGENEDEVLDLVRFALEQKFDISFIEEMPLGHIDSHARTETAFNSASIFESLESQLDLQPSDFVDLNSGPSRYYSARGSSSKIGFISPMTNNFCAACNRVRLTAQGKLLLCLGNEDALDLRALLRDGANIEDLQLAILKALEFKPKQHYFDASEVKITRFMSATGG